MSHYSYKTAGPVAPAPVAPGRLRLFHVDMNPYGHRVLLVLDAKRASYELCVLDPLRLPEWFKANNKKNKIPVLEVPRQEGEQYLFESVVICDYLDQIITRNPLHSTNAFRKAQDRLLIERFNELIKGTLECFDTNFEFGSEQIVQTIQVLEDELITRGTNYFGGSRPGMVDYMIWPWVERLYLIRAISPGKFDAKRKLFPNFADWGDQMMADEVVKKHARTPYEYLEYYKNARTHSMGYYL
ncbi:pyrimidodiazepine synthase-like [Leptidea sinapis]|uniref:pyrimidodiazepine synthase-like n=1 Tax=Leptidea sinapis TaxID=189913 RepID=UPI002138A8AD|nr:pyrimidodiazepine synthase-like [Leptidea sinapis]